MSYTQHLLERVAFSLARGGMEFEDFRAQLRAEYQQKYADAKPEPAEPPVAPLPRKAKR